MLRELTAKQSCLNLICAITLVSSAVAAASRAIAQETQGAVTQAATQLSASRRTPALLSPACGEELLAQSRPGTRVVQVTSGPEPGASDPLGVPAGRYQLFPDSGILAYIPKNSGVDATYYTTDKNVRLDLNTAEDLARYPIDPDGYGPTPVFATAGRILTPDHDNVVTATRTGNPGATGTVAIKFVEGGPVTQLPGNLLPRQAHSSDFLSITHADLDFAGDANGNLHDEVIVARVAGEDPDHSHYRFHLDVLNYSAGAASAPEITSADFADQAPQFTSNPRSTYSVLPSDNILSVVVGDFDGDGRREIAFVTLGNDTLLLYTYRYESVGGVHRLTQLRSQFFLLRGGILPNPANGLPIVGTLSAVAGDFDGDGVDELAIGYAKWNPETVQTGTYIKGVLTLKYGSNFEASIKDASWQQYIPRNADITYDQRVHVEVTAGQFLFDPPAIRYGRKQLVVAWNEFMGAPTETSTQLNLQALSVSADLKVSNLGGVVSTRVVGDRSLSNFSLAAGGFQGLANGKPTSSVAVGDWAGGGVGNYSTYQMSTFTVDSSGLRSASYAGYGINQGIDYRARLPVIAYDRPGNSRYLGAPAHLTIQSSPRTDYIMQEPPKHAYWNESDKKVVNFTRYDGNNVHLFNSNTASFSTSSTDQNAWSIGGSLAVSAGLTGNAGGSWGILKADVTTTVDVTAAASYDYSQNEEKYNSSYGERTVSSTGQTDRDDFLKGEVQTTDVWRYRVYGTPTGGPSNAFYELVFPGPKISFAAGGLNFDWYQPVHENGNLLSYPSRFGTNALIPSDMGSYTLPNGKTENTPQVPAELRLFDASSGSTELRYSNEVAAGGSFTYSHEIAESLDVKATSTASVSTPFGGGEARICGSVEVHNSNSWGGAKTSTETTKDETAVIFNQVPGIAANAYPFYPVVYSTKDGTIKLAFSAPDPTDRGLNPTGAETFATLYGGLPDPALNLPLRLLPTPRGSGDLEDWEPNIAISRKKMRGFFLRQAALDPGSNSYPLISFTPKAGDIVRIEPRIYNYSTGQVAVGTKVELQVIGYDDSRNSEICTMPINGSEGVTTGLVCPRSERKTIGSILIPRLEPRQFTCVSGFDDPAVTGCAPGSSFFDWDTTGYGPQQAGAAEYRIYAVINPDHSGGTEIYGEEPAPVPIENVINETPLVVTAPGHHLSTGDYVVIGGVRGLNAANSTFQVTYISDDQFSLDGSKTARGTYAGGGTATLLDPGQNNEGFSYIGVAYPNAATGSPVDDKSPRDFLEADALEAVSQSGPASLVPSAVTASQNVPLQLRLTAHSTKVHGDAAQMLLFDGDPTTGVPAIAAQTIHPGDHGREGTSTWMDWTPTSCGTHHLYAVLVEGTGDKQIASELTVNVVSKP